MALSCIVSEIQRLTGRNSRNFYTPPVISDRRSDAIIIDFYMPAVCTCGSHYYRWHFTSSPFRRRQFANYHTRYYVRWLTTAKDTICYHIHISCFIEIIWINQPGIARGWRRRNFVKMFDAEKKLEWLGYRKARKLRQYVKPFLSDTGTSRTDGRTDREQTDGQTELLYQYRASVCWCAIKKPITYYLLPPVDVSHSQM